MELGIPLTLLPALGNLFLLLGCLSQPQYEGFCFVLIYFVLSHLTVVSWKTVFSEENGRAVDMSESRDWGVGKSRGIKNCGLDIFFL